MKKITWSLLLLGFLSSNSLPQEGWNRLYPKPKKSLSSIYFFDNNNGCVVGNSGTIALTTDGGFNWDVSQSDSFSYSYGNQIRNNLRKVQFTDLNTGWVGGYMGIIWKTTDKGKNWVQKLNINTEPGPYSITNLFFFVNNYTGWAILDKGRLIKTNDGGDNWIYQSTGTTSQLLSLYFLDDKIGWAGGEGGIIIKTTDGGESWVKQNSIFNYSILGVQFFDQKNGRILAQTLRQSGSPGYYSVISAILKTTNGGENWIRNNADSLLGLAAFQFIDKNNGYASQDDFYHGMTRNLYKSTNNGETWSLQYTFNDIHGITSFYFVDELNGYVVGGENQIYNTTDGGISWTMQTLWYPSPVEETSLTSIKAIDENTLFITGVNGNIFKSTDAGDNWAIIQTFPLDLNDLFFFYNIGFIRGGDVWF